jgi:hypothetical protein
MLFPFFCCGETTITATALTPTNLSDKKVEAGHCGRHRGHIWAYRADIEDKEYLI